MALRLYEQDRPAVVEAIEYMRQRRGFISIFVHAGVGERVWVGAPEELEPGKEVPIETFAVLNRNAEMVRQILGDEGLHWPDTDPRPS